eukprot:CAMPEP_0174852090 /NCGR_PEP_ID=MMETSP1114-20130205/25183_1 /TAXON_ID=312471 /ORGANISM="Neobodo designis, Strain CCAP 1951/1" /LENGTH=578 /DNA_ID=CAMNT_0016086667 /DNA_START=156 /DNA_END=1888 /DNA_ORIENTATION=+
MEDIDLVRALASSSVDLLPFFFTLLWKRTNGTGTSHELRDIVIPDTVVLHRSRPIHWFFTSKEGFIRMKARRNLTTEVLLEHLAAPKRRSISGCATQFVRHEETCSDGVVVSHQLAEDLPTFVSTNAYAGLLQQYVDPKGERGSLRNFEIVSNWTPNVVYMERRSNDAKLTLSAHDHYVIERQRQQAAMAAGGSGTGLAMDESAAKRAAQRELDERCTAAETGRHVKTAAVVSHHTLQAIERTSTAIAEHIGLVFGVQVTNLTLHTKVDKNDRVVVLRCSALRCVDLRTRNAGGMALELRSIAAAAPGAVNRRGGRQSATSADGDDASASMFSDDAATSVSLANGSVRGERSMARKRRVCVLCTEGEVTAGDSEGRAPLGICRVARRHVLFPLSVMEFYSRHAQQQHEQQDATSTKSKAGENPVFTGDEEAARWTEADGVPAHVRLIAPELRPSDYAALRNDGKWLGEKINVCQSCADSIFAITTAIHVDESGQIRLPRKAAANLHTPHAAATGSEAASVAEPNSASAPAPAPSRQEPDAQATPKKQRPSPYQAKTPTLRRANTHSQATAKTPQHKRG